MSSTARQIIFWALIIVGAVALYQVFARNNSKSPTAIDYGTLVQKIRNGDVTELKISSTEAVATAKDGTFKIELSLEPMQGQLAQIASQPKDSKDPNSPPLVPKIENPSSSGAAAIGTFLLWYAPLLLILGVWIFMLRQVQSGGNKALSFGKSRAKLLNNQQKRVTFKDVAGVEEAKEELQEIIEFLKEPQKFQKLGGRIPKGVLMVGPPGTGKTLMARAVAGEANVPFFSISGSDFVEMFVGVGASRVRDLFEQGKKNAPCLTGDATITLSGGREISIQEMFDQRMVGVKVPAMTADFRLEDATVIGITRKRCADLYEITSASGQIKATGNHLFPVWRAGRMQWVRVDELQEGEYLAVPRQVKTTDKAPLFYDFLPDDTKLSFSYGTPLGRRPRLGDMRGEMPTRYRTVDSLALGPGGFRSSSLSRVPPYLTEEVAYLCGLLAADGYFGKPDSRSIQFINTELALHEKVSAILDTQFGYEPKRHLNKKRYETILPQGTQPQQLQDCYTTFINNRLLCEALRAIDRRILELPAHLIAAWLRGMFDGDGYVRANKSTPQVTISAWKRDENLRVRAALLRVGIATSYAPAAHAGKDGNITITGLENLQTFLSAIGSFHPAKQAKLVELREMLEGRQTSASRVDCIPVGGLLREARMSVGMGQRSFARGNYVSGYERGLVTPSRTSLQNVVAESETWREEREIPPTEETAQLKDLAHSDVLWSPVRSVKPIEPVEFVYDLCLDRHHSLLANLMITHNCIVFIDEIDAVGRHRGAGLGGGHDEREQTLNQLLVEMDGFESSDGVIIMASTNRPDVLDPALLRPGRFDRRVVVSRPDVRGREGILKVHTRKIPLGEDVDISVVARSTPGFTGADLANLVNEAALNAARYNKKTVAMSDFELAKDKVLMGAERRSMVISDEEKRITAYHEAGHTLVGLKIPTADPVHKVTIIPRGMALGLTQQLPEGDRHSYTKEYLLGQIAILMGGRIAEDVFIHSITTGASNDIERATELARAMVCEYGMSELGPLTFGKKEEQIFLGREIAQHRDYSEDTAIRIDQEVKKIVQEQYDLARKIITDNSDAMERLAQALLEYETLDSVQIRRVVAGLPLDGDGGGEPSAPSGNLLPEAKEPVSSPLKPILPPITGPVTA